MRGRVVVTGASGFVGRALVEAIARSRDAIDVQLVAVSRRDLAGTLPEGVRFRRGDLAREADVHALFTQERPEIVFHLASLVTGGRDPSLVIPTFRANLEATVFVLTEAAAAKTRRVVLAGSLEEPEPGEAAGSPYAVAKQAASDYARFFHALYGLDVVIARLFMVYGPGQVDAKKLVPYVVLSLLAGEAPQLSSGDRPVDWIYIDDVVDGLMRLGDAPGVGGKAIDLGSGSLATVRDVASRLAALAPAGAPAIAFGAVSDRKLERVRQADPEPARAALGWRPRVALDEGLARTFAWYRAEREAGRL